MHGDRDVVHRLEGDELTVDLELGLDLHAQLAEVTREQQLPLRLAEPRLAGDGLRVLVLARQELHGWLASRRKNSPNVIARRYNARPRKSSIRCERS